MKKILFLIFFTLLSFYANASSMPDETGQVVDGIYTDWTVFVLDNDVGGKKCYIATFPKKSIGNYKEKREPYVLITRFERKKVEEVSIYSGYEYKLNSNIFVSIDSDQYRMFVKDDIAWAKSEIQDKEMIKKMLKGATIKVRGESSSGSYTVDEYSLKGITQAYRRMKELCKEEQ